jgi:hypothetical protein
VIFYSQASTIGYVGSSCSTPVSCFGLAWNDANVCSGNGICQGTDLCICNTGFYGSSCATTACSAIPVMYGRNEVGQAGNGTSTSVSLAGAQAVPSIGSKQYSFVAKSTTTSFAVMNDNTFYAFGAKFVQNTHVNLFLTISFYF